MKHDPKQQHRFEMIEAFLPHVPFEGWDIEAIAPHLETPFDPDLMAVLFPHGKRDILDAFANWLDHQMLARLESFKKPEKIRARIGLALETRFRLMSEHMHAEKDALGYWGMPIPSLARSTRAKRLVWRTADHIWTYAGDDSDDYNHYTKRTILSAVIVRLTLQWLRETSETQSVDALIATMTPQIYSSLDRVVTVMSGISKAKPLMDRLWRISAPLRTSGKNTTV